MKYFKPDLLWESNSVDDESPRRKWLQRWYKRSVKNYDSELERLRHRVSRRAWVFFRYGFARWGLHDAQLLSFTVGDGLDYAADGRRPFRLNYQKAACRIQFLSYYQDLLYTFEYKGLHNIECNVGMDEMSLRRGRPAVGDVLTYELVRYNREFLQNEFLFASDAFIRVVFRRLIFRRQRIKRRYPSGEMYA